MTSYVGSGYFIASDPDQEKAGLYKVCKTANMTTTITQLNAARANKDFKIIKFFPVTDLKKAEDFIKSALKNKYIPNSVEWIKADTDAALVKVQNIVETLVDIVNGSDE